jgi:uncharacterized protein
MFVLLPPSEGKAVPGDGPAVQLDSLMLPELTRARERMLGALIKVSSRSPKTALPKLGLTAGQVGELAHNQLLRTSGAVSAADLYTGVLYDALDLPGLAATEPAAFAAADRSVLIFSSLWGALRPGDRVPHYRCSAGTQLPVIGSVDALWKRELRKPLDNLVGDELVVDLRSTAYAGMWRPGPNSVSVRVLQEREVDGVVKRSVVSHFNKATKGRLVRALLLAGAEPKNADEFAAAAASAGFTIESAMHSAFDLVLRD